MLSNHGKQYKSKIEAMSNKKNEDLKKDLLDLSTNTFDIINKVKNLIDVPVNKMTLHNQRNTMSHNNDDIYTGNVFKDVCGNYFLVNDKGVIRQYYNPSSYVINELYKKNNVNRDIFSDKNFTDLKMYDEFIVDDSYNFIKGTNIGVTDEAHEGKYNLDGSKNSFSNCYTLKSGQNFTSDATFSKTASPFECKQLAIDNFFKHYILQKDADGSLNCFLSNNDNILNYYDVSANACESEGGLKKGIAINKSYSIFNNKQIGINNNDLQGGRVDFDTSFVRKNQDSVFKNNIYNSSLDIVEPFETITQSDFLKDYPDIVSRTNTIAKNNKKIYKELEKYNKIIRHSNLGLANNISLNMNYVNNIEELKYAFNNEPNLKNIQELKRKLDNEKLVLSHSYNNFVLWSLLGVATLIILFKVSKPSNS